MRYKHEAQHWPGAVGMFTESPSKYFAGRSHSVEGPIGYWQGFAASHEDAQNRAMRVAENAERGGRCAVGLITHVTLRKLTVGELAAVITGKPIAEVVT